MGIQGTARKSLYRLMRVVNTCLFWDGLARLCFHRNRTVNKRSLKHWIILVDTLDTLKMTNPKK